MIKTNNFVTKSKKSIQADLRKEFILAQKDEMFTKLCNRLKSNEETLMRYTSKLELSVCELKNCTKCKGLDYCKNEVTGHVYYTNIVKENIEFVYKPCKHFKQNKIKNTTKFFETPKTLVQSSLSELIDEKERNNILKYIQKFLKKKMNNENVKGLYLSGSFGSGKSYILSAVLNELSNKGFKTVNVYYPALLKKLKMSFNDYSYDDVLDEIMKSDILLIDDNNHNNDLIHIHKYNRMLYSLQTLKIHLVLLVFH